MFHSSKFLYFSATKSVTIIKSFCVWRTRQLDLNNKMAQKSIKFFFSKSTLKDTVKNQEPVTPKKKIEVENEDSCSPVKIGARGSKRLRIESDSDSNSPPEKRTSSETDSKRNEDTPTKVSKVKTELDESDEDKCVETASESEEKTEKSNVSGKSSKGKTEKKKEKKESPKNAKKSPTQNKKNNKKEKKETSSASKKKKETKKSSPKSEIKEHDDEEIVVKKKIKKNISDSEDSNCETEEKMNVSTEENGQIKEEKGSKSPVKESVAKPEKKPQGFHSFFTSNKNTDKTAVKDSKTVEVVTGLTYNPSKSNYHPIDDAFWSRNDKVPYLALSRTLEEIEKISARLKIVEMLSNFFRSVIVLNQSDLLPSVYLCLNRLAPAYESVELGIAETTLMKAIAQSTGRSLAQIKSDCNSTGDLGLVAEQSKSNQRMMFQPAPLTIRGVFDKLKDIAQMTGHASMAKKVDKIQSMFVACRHSEARFLIRSLAGKLRVGLAEQSVLQALAQACTTTPPMGTQEDPEAWPPKVLNTSKGLTQEQFKAQVDKQALILKTIYCECPNYDMIIPVALQHGISELPSHCRLTPGIPLKPMLAHPTKGVHEVLQRFENVEFTCEWKYDGERAQIHVPSMDKDGEVISNIAKASVYSRNQENNTSKYPDVLGRLSKALKDTVKSCVLDCEAVAWDKENKKILPFQVLSTRKKKDANEAEIKVEVCLFMFDLLYLNGEALVKKPFEERRKLLRENFNEIEGEWHMATSLDCSSIESIQEFLEESVRGNCEGLMVKTLNGKDATYEIAKRSRNWLKLKKDYLEGVGDTIDAVVIGGYLGRGKRAGVYGGFLLACHDRQTDEYQSLCKIGTGFSDQDLQNHSKTFAEHIIQAPKGYYRFDSSLEPDHWFDAVQVWEVKCADLSLSPIHRAAMGIVDPEKGISLRFPRFIRIREDKGAEDATSAQQIAELYCSQDQVKNQAQNTNKNFEEDFY